LKANARNDRWREELTLIVSEMDWTERFFYYMAQTWENLASEQSRAERSHEEELLSDNESGREVESGGELHSGGGEQSGGKQQLSSDQLAGRPPRAVDIYTRSLAAYAAKEGAKWSQMAVRAHTAFSAIRLKHGIE
jgi:hypothetical protein